MNCTINNVDWCFVTKTIFSNKWFLIFLGIMIPLIIYVKFKWQIRAWKIKKFNPKHVITAIFLNKERCISLLPMVVNEQTNFTFLKETYLADKKAIFNKYDFKKSLLQISDDLKKYSKEFELPKNNIIEKTANELREIEEYSIIEKGMFHIYHGKRWFWQKQSTGEAYSIYVDGVSQPILADWLLQTNGIKYNAEVIYDLARQTFFKQLLTDTNKVNWKLILIILGIVILTIALYYYTQQNGGKLI